MLYSDQRTDAILLESLLCVDPYSILCTKLCKGLQANKVKDKYFRIKEKNTSDFVANIWYDNDYCGQHQYKGIVTDDTNPSVTSSKRNYHYDEYRPRSTIGWTEHEKFRDERAEAFRSLLGSDVYEWSYVMRATCAGTFIILPAKAEEMYSPEKFGRCATEKVIIE
ncbi:unnamed protein product [Rotaria sp. Silwood1]|nr:unnamed protein product [Rotaria sp. Silwood1]